MRSVPGRLRLELGGWAGNLPRRLARDISAIRGVVAVDANPHTRRILIRFDEAEVDERELLDALARLPPLEGDVEDEPPGKKPDALVERREGVTRARITVRGLDRNQAIGAELTNRLGALRGVRRVSVSSLTSRILVEFAGDEIGLDELIADVEGVELPPVAGEDLPAHPLDPEPLIESGSRLVGAIAGLALLGGRRAAGASGPPTAARGPAELAALLGVAEGFPPVRNSVRRVLGVRGTEALFVGAGATALTLSGSALGLLVAGAGALRLWTEANARRRAWQSYEQRVEHFPEAHPGEVVWVEGGERVPLAGEVAEGAGTAEDASGWLIPIEAGSAVPAGARLHGGPFAVALEGDGEADAMARASPPRPALYDQYLELVPWLSLGYAVLTGVLTRSVRRAFIAFVVVNPRSAVSTIEVADLSASARLLRAGLIVVGTRRRELRRPDLLLLDGARPLFDGRQVEGIEPAPGQTPDAILSLAAKIATAAGSPWPRAFPGADVGDVESPTFEGGAAWATIEGRRYRLAGDDLLELSAGDALLGKIGLVRRPARGLDELVDRCSRFGVRLQVVGAGPAMADAARLVGLETVSDGVAAITEAQYQGERVAFASDSAQAASPFAAADLAIGLASGRSGRFSARADVLAPDLGGIATLIEAAARRDAAAREGTLLTLAANAAGGIWALRTQPQLQRAAYPLYLATLAGQGLAAFRLRGGRRPSALATLADPRPERWGRLEPEDVCSRLETSRGGLSADEALRRRRRWQETEEDHPVIDAATRQLASPLTAMLAVGAGLSYAFGTTADVGVIAAVIAVNCAVGAWQEQQADAAAEALARRATPSARVRRDGEVVLVPADEVVPGDILVLASGDRIAADARLLAADQLEVDEAALTGESVPVLKAMSSGRPENEVVLAGCDVVVGTGEAVVVGVGPETRLGATAAMLGGSQDRQGALEQRLSHMLNQVLPISIAGGALVIAAGLLWRRPLVEQLAIGASVAIAALPEGLPLLAGVAEASVARRLAQRNALVRRLAAVEALGRIDTACVDKTGTLTEGRLRVRVVADLETESAPAELTAPLTEILVAAALASPHPDAHDVDAHPTDRAVIAAAEAAGLADPIRAPRHGETRFDPNRGFSAAARGNKVVVKGAAEVLVPSCTGVRTPSGERGLDQAERRRVLARAEELAARGLRVLLVTEGEGTTEDPRDLTVLGFIGISDPLRAGVAAAVERCRSAGIRVIMLTGDHSATARAVAAEAGLSHDGEDVVAGDTLDEESLDRALETASVIARVTPFDKVWIIERLQARGHVVAMTGDGVNDAPALRLADVGVAMGKGGTDVAAEAADLVLADDDFATLVEALVEGRGFWRNIRRALALLLGGNLGEIGLMVGATALGQPAPLTARQVLAVNLLTDVLPAIAVAVQEPEHNELAGLAREGLAGLDEPLRNEAVARGLRTAVPSLIAFLVARLVQDVPQARTVGLGSVVGTQLAQTFRLGQAQGRPTRAVTAGVTASAALVAAGMAVPAIRRFFSLAAPSPVSLAIVAGAVALAYVEAPWTGLTRAGLVTSS